MNKPSKPSASVENSVKELLSDSASRIVLDDYVTALLRQTLDGLASGSFAVVPPEPNSDTIRERVKQYDDITRDLIAVSILLGRWGEADHFSLVEKIVSRLAEAAKPPSNYVAWMAMHWYPLELIFHAAGIAALSAKNYAVLPTLLLPSLAGEIGSPSEPAIVRVRKLGVDLGNSLKLLPGHERDRVPRSEHLFSVLREPLDRILFLGSSYEQLFDQFEIAATLTYADRTADGRDGVWAAPGRFVYKRGNFDDPYSAFVKRAEAEGDNWPFVKVGLFSSFARAHEIIAGYNEFLSKISRF